MKIKVKMLLFTLLFVSGLNAQIITIGDTMLAETAASPSISAPTTFIALPEKLGEWISASLRTSKVKTKRSTSTAVGKGTPSLCAAKEISN